VGPGRRAYARRLVAGLEDRLILALLIAVAVGLLYSERVWTATAWPTQ